MHVCVADAASGAKVDWLEADCHNRFDSGHINCDNLLQASLPWLLKQHLQNTCLLVEATASPVTRHL